MAGSCHVTRCKLEVARLLFARTTKRASIDHSGRCAKATEGTGVAVAHAVCACSARSAAAPCGRGPSVLAQGKPHPAQHSMVAADLKIAAAQQQVYFDVLPSLRFRDGLQKTPSIRSESTNQRTPRKESVHGGGEGRGGVGHIVNASAKRVAVHLGALTAYMLSSSPWQQPSTTTRMALPSLCNGG